MREYTDAEKAAWILEHGGVEHAWIFERVGDRIYRRPMAPQDGELPPWISAERELFNMYDKHGFNILDPKDIPQENNDD